MSRYVVRTVRFAGDEGALCGHEHPSVGAATECRMRSPQDGGERSVLRLEGHGDVWTEALSVTECKAFAAAVAAATQLRRLQAASRIAAEAKALLDDEHASNEKLRDLAARFVEAMK